MPNRDGGYYPELHYHGRIHQAIDKTNSKKGFAPGFRNMHDSLQKYRVTIFHSSLLGTILGIHEPQPNPVKLRTPRQLQRPAIP